MTLLEAPVAVITATSHDQLQAARDRASTWRSDTVNLTADIVMADGVLDDLITASSETGNAKFGRVAQSIAAARSGQVKPIPSLGAAPAVIVAFLRIGIIDGWVYAREKDGHLHPYLVAGVQVESTNDGRSFLTIRLKADNLAIRRGERGETGGRTIHLDASEVTRKHPADVLLAAGIYKETQELKAEYVIRRARYEEIASGGFAEQYRFTGTVFSTDDYRAKTLDRVNRRVVHDIAPAEMRPFAEYAPSALFFDDDDEGVGPVPVLTVLRVFDLHSHDHVTVNIDDLTDYVYDKTLRDKLILPDDQRELLDILTTDIGTFTGDIVEGKTAGNVILGKGIPGVGKTLTAEVYSELIERPLYSIHSGSLGISADDVRKNLETVFARAKRWNAVLLLDEADVFVLERGANLQQNAIVAEFLRTMEYFDGLLFMTTNRANNIDDAILSRCAAIIDYQVPGPADARKVWQVLATNNKAVIPAAVLDELVDGYAHITPRDIKMLLRLALRVAAHRDATLTVDLFRQCGIFRGLHFTPTAAAA